jgi:hypothetical protein
MNKLISALAAAVMLSAAYGQNIGLVTSTNGTVVSGRSGSLTFTNTLAFSNPTTTRSNLVAMQAPTVVSITGSMTLPTNATTLALLDSGSISAGGILVTLPTNATHGNVVEVRNQLSTDNAAITVTNTGFSGWTVRNGQSMFAVWSTNIGPSRWMGYGRTIPSSWVLGQLATNDAVPSGAASSNSILRADGSGGSTFVADGVYLARQTTNGPTVTNGTTTSSLVISNVPAGLYWVQGQMNSTATTGRNWLLLTPNQVFSPRMLLGWFETGGAGGFFNASTNMQANNDGATGARNIAIAGPLLFTNSATVSFNVIVSSTNTAQVLSNSFILLRKLD